MKQITYADVAPVLDRVGPCVGLINAYCQKYILKHERHGWIFRQVGNQNYGHSGQHERRDEACELALSVAGTLVFEFESQAALDAWAHQGEVTTIKLTGNMIEIPIDNPMGD